MGKLNIDKVEPGMRVTSPVINDKGMVLLPADSEITATILERLKKWGIQSINVNIDGSTAHTLSTLTEEVLNKKIESIKLKFSPYLSDPLMHDIFDQFVKYFHSLSDVKLPTKEEGAHGT